EMLTGSPVFERGSVPKTLYAIVNGERPDLDRLLEFRAPFLVQLLNRALATDPHHRVQTARELAEGLDAATRMLDGQSAGSNTSFEGRKLVDREGLGASLRDLFRDVEDPLARFDPIDPPVAAPMPPPRAGDSETRSAAVIRETIEEKQTVHE